MLAREQRRPVDRVPLVGAQEVHGENAGTNMSDVPADAAFDGAIVRVVGIVSALSPTEGLPGDDKPEVTDIEPVLDRRGPATRFGVAGAAGQAGVADHRKPVGAAHRIIGIDRIQQGRVGAAEGQRAPNRRAHADKVLRGQPTPAAGVVRDELFVLGYADRIKHRLWRVGQQQRIRIERKFVHGNEVPARRNRNGGFHPDERLAQGIRGELKPGDPANRVRTAVANQVAGADRMIWIERRAVGLVVPT